MQNNIKDFYNEMCNEFDKSRVRIWPHVSNFLSNFNSSDYLLDVGCGNGKNILANPQLNFKGIDISENLVKICQNKKLDVITSDMCNIPFDDNTFNGIICIASYHHLSTDNDRRTALNEMYRLLKKDGLLLITVWAMEQPPESTFNFKHSDELVKWTSVKTKKTYYRYYHIYRKDELLNEIKTLAPQFKIINNNYEKGNWNIILSK